MKKKLKRTIAALSAIAMLFATAAVLPVLMKTLTLVMCILPRNIVRF